MKAYILYGVWGHISLTGASKFRFSLMTQTDIMMTQKN